MSIAKILHKFVAANNRVSACKLSILRYSKVIRIAVGVSCCVVIGACDQKSDDGMFVTDKSESTNIPLVEPRIKVMTPDWGVAAELKAMGYPVAATGDMRRYKEWMGYELPADTHDLGIRFQPNPELLAQLEIDLVIDNFFYKHIRPIYGDIPAQEILFKSKNKVAKWEDFVKPTLELGEAINQPELAKQYISKTEQKLVDTGLVFKKAYPQISKLAIVQFSGVSNLRAYGSNSLYQVALDKMDLELLSLGEPSKWGFASIQMSDLSSIEKDTCLIIVKPFSPMLQVELNDSLLWRRLGFGADKCMAIAEPVWMYGGFASMLSFAEKLPDVKLQGIAVAPNSTSNIDNNSESKIVNDDVNNMNVKFQVGLNDNLSNGLNTSLNQSNTNYLKINTNKLNSLVNYKYINSYTVVGQEQINSLCTSQAKLYMLQQKGA